MQILTKKSINIIQRCKCVNILLCRVTRGENCSASLSVIHSGRGNANQLRLKLIYDQLYHITFVS